MGASRRTIITPDTYVRNIQKDVKKYFNARRKISNLRFFVFPGAICFSIDWAENL